MSTPTARRSAIAARTSSRVSPMPRMMPDFVDEPGVARARASTDERARVPGRRARRALQPRDRLEVVVQHVGASREDRGERRRIALAVGDQHLDVGVRVASPAPRATVAANTDAPPSARSSRATHVITACASPIVRDRVGDAARLVGVDRHRLARVDQAEAARPRAAVAEDHERGGAVGPALVDVRAAGLLAHGVQVEPAHRSASARGSRRRSRARTRIHSGRCAPASGSASTPAAASRPSSRTGETPGAPPSAVNGATTAGALPGDILAFDRVEPERLGEARDDRGRSTARIAGASPEHPRHRRDAAVRGCRTGRCARTS